MKYLKWLNPFEWGTLTLQIVGGLVALGLLVWYIDGKLNDHYTDRYNVKVEAATAKADAKVAIRQADNEKKAKEAANEKVKTLEINLAAATSTAESRGRLLDDVRSIQERTKNSTSACSQYSATLGELLASGTELAGRIAAEADGHLADKIACAKAWPTN